MIEPNWTLIFSRKPGRWWVRLLACGRYNHVKAIAYIPALGVWLLYDVKFNGTRLLLLRDQEPGCRVALFDYLEGCDAVALPRQPVPRRFAPQLGFWCTLAIKHLVGVRELTLRPDRLWRAAIAAGGRPFLKTISTSERSQENSFDAMLTFLTAHGSTVSAISWANEAAFGRTRPASRPEEQIQPSLAKLARPARRLRRRLLQPSLARV